MASEFNVNSAATIGADDATKIATFNDEKVKLWIWNTAGLEKFHAVANIYQEADAVLLMYDNTNEDPLATLKTWSEKAHTDTI